MKSKWGWSEDEIRKWEMSETKAGIDRVVAQIEIESWAERINGFRFAFEHASQWAEQNPDKGAEDLVAELRERLDESCRDFVQARARDVPSVCDIDGQ